MSWVHAHRCPNMGRAMESLRMVCVTPVGVRLSPATESGGRRSGPHGVDSGSPWEVSRLHSASVTDVGKDPLADGRAWWRQGAPGEAVTKVKVRNAGGLPGGGGEEG